MPDPQDVPTDRIEKKILLRAPRSRVWRALTDPVQFGQWFGARMPAGAFVPGRIARAPITHPGYEHLTLEITIEKMEPERLFSWRWHPNAVDPKHDYAKDPTTLVVFTLEEAEGGTLLTMVESGFDKVPSAYRATAFRSNRDGWAEQMKNIERHVATNPAT
jgi:uncharacterized protein YndB with AHSA1/START domain